MKNALLASLAIVSNAAVPTTRVANYKYEPSAINKYDYQKFIEDIQNGLKNPHDIRENGLVKYLKNPTKMDDQHTEIIDIFTQYNEMLQKDPSFDTTKFIKDFITNHDFSAIGFDEPTNDGIYKNLLISLKGELERKKSAIKDLRHEEYEVKAQDKIKAFATKYNLNYDHDESAISKNIYENLGKEYFTILNNTDVQNPGRPYVKSQEFIDAFKNKVDDLLKDQGNISTIEMEMLKNFEDKVKAIKLPTDFTVKKLMDLNKSPDSNKFETVFKGLGAIEKAYTDKQPNAKFDIDVTNADYDKTTGKTTFTFKTSLNNSSNEFKIEVDTAKYENIATKIKEEIEKAIAAKQPTVEEKTADTFMSDTDFSKFIAAVKEIKDAIEKVPNYNKVTYKMTANYDSSLTGPLKNSKMNIDLEITDTTETDPVLKKVSTSFVINIKRIIDEDFKKVEEAIKSKNPSSVFLADAKKTLFAPGSHLSERDVFDFLHYVKQGKENVEKVITDYNKNSKAYKLTATVKGNSYQNADKNKRVLEIEYTFEEKNGKKNLRTYVGKYNITETAVDTIVEEIKKLKLTDPNPVTPNNIDNWASGPHTISNLSKLLKDIEKVINDANSLTDKVSVNWSKFYKDKDVLYTDFTVYQNSNQAGTSVTFKKDISHKFIGQAEKDAAKQNNEKSADQYKQIIDMTKDENLRDNLKVQIDQIKNEANIQIDNPNVKTEFQIDQIVDAMDKRMKAVVALGLKSDYDRLIEEAKEKYGDPLPPEIKDQIDREYRDILDKLKDLNPKDVDIKKIMELLKNFKLSDLLAKAKMLSNLSKYALVGIGGILGIGGLVSLYNALKIWTTNKKMKDIPNNKLKLKSAKKMGFLSMVIGILAVGGSVALMLFIFIVKGGF